MLIWCRSPVFLIIKDVKMKRYVPKSRNELRQMRCEPQARCEPCIQPCVDHTLPSCNIRNPSMIHPVMMQPRILPTQPIFVDPVITQANFCMHAPYHCLSHRHREFWCRYCISRYLWPEMYPCVQPPVIIQNSCDPSCRPN